MLFLTVISSTILWVRFSFRVSKFHFQAHPVQSFIAYKFVLICFPNHSLCYRWSSNRKSCQVFSVFKLCVSPLFHLYKTNFPFDSCTRYAFLCSFCLLYLRYVKPYFRKGNTQCVLHVRMIGISQGRNRNLTCPIRYELLYIPSCFLVPSPDPGNIKR